MNLSTSSPRQFKTRDFPSATLEQSINYLTYGLIVKKWAQKRKSFHEVRVYLMEDDDTFLQWLSRKKPYTETRVDLRSVVSLTDKSGNNQVKNQNHRAFLLFLTYGENKIISFNFDIEKKRNLFWQGLQHFIQKSHSHSETHASLSKRLFITFDLDGTKYLDKKEVRNLLKELHVNYNNENFNREFEEFDKNKNDKLEYEEFKNLMNKLLYKSELEPLFIKYCERADEGIKDNEKPVMKMLELKDFFKNEQQENYNDLELNHLVKKYIENSDDKKLNEISFLTFCNIIFSSHNIIYDHSKEIVYQDMNQPLSDYWINSSHNTYLLSNQLTGQSSPQAYINAFNKGCRCVELDCWDGEKGEPIITHGHTFTSKIKFEDVIQTIKDFGFEHNPYPIILSIENHCSNKQQDKMAEILERILEKSLYTVPPYWESIDHYPSPNELKYKILIKDKGKLIKKSEGDIDENEISENILEKEMHVSTLNNFQTAPFGVGNYLKLSSQDVFKFDSDQEDLNTFGNKNKYHYEPNFKEIEKKINNSLQNNYNKTPILPTVSEKHEISNESDLIVQKKKEKSLPACGKLSKLISIFGCKMKLGDPNRLIWQISSLNEDKVSLFLSKNEKEFIDHNKKTFTRTYPAGLRIDSSNYDPLPAFNSGCHIIALNFQTNDINLLVYLSRFIENGGIGNGYVLKPDFMLSKNKKPLYLSDFSNPKIELTIQIISGSQFKPIRKKEKDILDPFVEINIRGITIDEKKNEAYKSNIVEDNGLNPIFKDSLIKFYIHCPDLAFVVFQVYDGNTYNTHERLAWFALPINRIRKGYRVVPLKSINDLSIIEHSYILCHIDFKFL